VYDAFLVEFPLCYGYWKKYALAEFRHGDVTAATNVFERGLEAIPYSVDLWASYCDFKRKTGDGPEDVRRQGTPDGMCVCVSLGSVRRPSTPTAMRFSTGHLGAAAGPSPSHSVPLLPRPRWRPGSPGGGGSPRVGRMAFGP
jgi:hypothetical protein